jgi:hypothetical protein
MSDIELAKAVDRGEMTRVDMVEQIIEDEQDQNCPIDPFGLARRIINALDY